MSLMKATQKNIILAIIFGFLLFLGFICFFSARWYISTFGDVGFDSILYTLFSDLNGVESGQVINYLIYALLPTVILTVVLTLIFFIPIKRNLTIKLSEKIKLQIFPFSKWFSSVICILLSFLLILSAAQKVDMTSYLKYAFMKSTTFIEDNYVNPENVNITFPEKKQNLIIIYLESMETSFLSEEYKGGNDVNPMPELCDLAEENINFSHNETVGGFSSLSGGTWTIGALVSMTAGVPLKIPLNINLNSYGSQYFLPGITTLSDILNDKGYYQALMVGSDSNYGGRRQYYEQHGTDTVYDLYSARASGLVYPEYWVWWGVEDRRMFEYAKIALPGIAKQDKPFAFSFLTVDTHHVDGYFCDFCKNEYPEQYENVLACASRQVEDFLEWVKEQDFYENTTIIITGDHPTMDAGYIQRNIPEEYDRKVYNCFINSLANTENIKNRDFCSLDMFPTILASIGCEIEGDRLGLGTNLFSSTPTLCESMGYDKFDEELDKKSDYYDSVFMGLDF